MIQVPAVLQSRYPLLLLSLAGAALAFQGGAADLALPAKFLENSATSALFFHLDAPPYFPREATTAYRAMDAAARTRLVNDLAPTLKALVSAPAFQQAYETHIARNAFAVNHNLPAKTWLQILPTAKPGPKGSDQLLEAAQSAAEGMAQLPADMIGPMLKDDLNNWTRQSIGRGGNNGKYLILATRARALTSIQKSNPKLFQKGYGLLKALDMYNLEKEHLLLGISAEEGAQLRYSELQFKAVLKGKLTEFAALAKSVDYAAATSQTPRRTFVKPDYEKKPAGWKFLFRLGQAPSLAAAAFAEQWAKEL